MKCAQSLVNVLAENIQHAFVVSGGANLHILDAISKTNGKIQNICTQHEQAAGFAADAYARFNGLGCAIVTSGPGFANLLTAIQTSYYDSVPVIYIAGQVSTSMLDTKGTRQIGFQHSPAVPLAGHFTKMAVEPVSAADVPQWLHELIKVAKSGRPGPVMLSLCDDIQRETI